MNPLKKVLSLLGFQAPLVREIENEPGTCSGSRVPLHKRVAKRRRNNKRARAARRRNRS